MKTNYLIQLNQFILIKPTPHNQNKEFSNTKTLNNMIRFDNI